MLTEACQGRRGFRFRGARRVLDNQGREAIVKISSGRERGLRFQMPRGGPKWRGQGQRPRGGLPPGTLAVSPAEPGGGLDIADAGAGAPRSRFGHGAGRAPFSRPEDPANRGPWGYFGGGGGESTIRLAHAELKTPKCLGDLPGASESLVSLRVGASCVALTTVSPLPRPRRGTRLVPHERSWSGRPT